MKSYLKELAIVSIGVLIALFVNNLKESLQATNYYATSMKTVRNEVQTNYADLKKVIERHYSLLDSIKTHRSDEMSLGEVIEKGGGLQIATLSNTGLEFYKKNNINLIDFDVMSRLIEIQSISKVANSKMEKLLDFLYPSIFDHSEESKMKAILYLTNVLDSEHQLKSLYEMFIEEHIKNNTPNGQNTK